MMKVLYLISTSCSWVQNKILYLSYYVSRDSIQINPNKIKAILEWPVPQNHHQHLWIHQSLLATIITTFSHLQTWPMPCMIFFKVHWKRVHLLPGPTNVSKPLITLNNYSLLPIYLFTSFHSMFLSLTPMPQELALVLFFSRVASPFKNHLWLFILWKNSKVILKVPQLSFT